MTSKNRLNIQKENESMGLSITRIYIAPRELVFKAWTDPEYMKQWWGPHGFTNPVCELDARPGGLIYIDMTAPDGLVFPMGGMFCEIEKPLRLVFTSTVFEDEEGNSQLQNLNTVTFIKEQGKTRMMLQVVIIKSSPEAKRALDGMQEGWNQSLDKLAELLVKTESINN